jgi:hypothetical protein
MLEANGPGMVAVNSLANDRSVMPPGPAVSGR